MTVIEVLPLRKSQSCQLFSQSRLFNPYVRKKPALGCTKVSITDEAPSLNSVSWHHTLYVWRCYFSTNGEKTGAKEVKEWGANAVPSSLNWWSMVTMRRVSIISIYGVTYMHNNACPKFTQSMTVFIDPILFLQSTYSLSSSFKRACS